MENGYYERGIFTQLADISRQLTRLADILERIAEKANSTSKEDKPDD